MNSSEKMDEIKKKKLEIKCSFQLFQGSLLPDLKCSAGQDENGIREKDVSWGFFRED